jgi:hypothetical protein
MYVLSSPEHDECIMSGSKKRVGLTCVSTEGVQNSLVQRENGRSLFREQVGKKWPAGQFHQNYRLKAQWLLYVPHAYNTINFCILSHTVYLCVPYGSHIIQRLFLQTALTGWAL